MSRVVRGQISYRKEKKKDDGKKRICSAQMDGDALDAAISIL